MYREIETKFKDKSNINFENTLYVVFTGLYAWLTIHILSHFEPRSYLLITVIAFVIFFTLLYVYVYFRGKRKTLNPFRVLDNFRKQQRLEDKNLLARTIIQNGITDKQKLLEVIRHYQVLIPRNNQGSGFFVSLFAILLAIIALFFQVGDDWAKFQVAVILVVTALLSLLVLARLSRYLYRLYGNIYVRIEESLSSIYFDDNFDFTSELSNLEKEEVVQKDKKTIKKNLKKADEKKVSKVKSKKPRVSLKQATIVPADDGQRLERDSIVIPQVTSTSAFIETSNKIPTTQFLQPDNREPAKKSASKKKREKIKNTKSVSM